MPQSYFSVQSVMRSTTCSVEPVLQGRITPLKRASDDQGPCAAGACAIAFAPKNFGGGRSSADVTEFSLGVPWSE